MAKSQSPYGLSHKLVVEYDHLISTINMLSGSLPLRSAYRTMINRHKHLLELNRSAAYDYTKTRCTDKSI